MLFDRALHDQLGRQQHVQKETDVNRLSGNV